MKEAAARIKINRLLEEAGGRFFDDDNGRANICLEAHVTIKHSDLNALGDDFEAAAESKGRNGNGFVDFLLLDYRGFPFIVLEAKSEDKNPLVGKEQARTYARAQNCRFVILSNGNLHYFWDLEHGNPSTITAFPTPASADERRKVTPNPQRLVDEPVEDNYISVVRETSVGLEGMKVDRMLFDRFAGAVRADQNVAAAVEAGQWDRVIDYVNHEVFDKPEEYYTLDKLRAAVDVDRRLTLREILEKVFDLIPRFKSKDELLEEEFANFIAQHPPERSVAFIVPIKHFFKAYATDGGLRAAIDARKFAGLATHPAFSRDDYRAVPEKYRELVPKYIKDYVSLNQFAA